MSEQERQAFRQGDHEEYDRIRLVVMTAAGSSWHAYSKVP